MYVGKASNLRRRFGDYLTREQSPTGRPKVRRFLYLYDGFIWFCFVELPNEILNDCEDALIAAYVPPLNSELPGEIRAPRRAF
jgi:excinuclease UvrABC nuclease subunit